MDSRGEGDYLFRMGLRGKSIAIILTSFFCVCVVFFGMSAQFYSMLLEKQGKKEALQAFNRVTARISEDLNQLTMLANDWGVWNDLYFFVQDRSPAFRESNLNRETLQALELSELAIYAADGTCIFQGGNESALWPLLAPGTTTFSTAERGELSKVVVSLNNELHLACVRKILRSDGSGPSVGILVMARGIGIRGISKWQGVTGTVIREEDLKTGSLPAFGSPESFTRLSDRYALQGPLPYGLSLTSTPSLIVAPDIPSTVFGTSIFGMFSGLLAVLFLVIIALSLVAFERLVLRRLRFMKNDLEAIAAAGRPSLRIRMNGPPDELSQFAIVLNRTLDALERSFLEIDENRKLVEHSLAEQEALFREVRHRVKNNLQLVVSLLNLQEESCTVPEAIGMLEEGKRRVLAMAFVHEELYLSPTMNRINLSQYLERLIVSIQHSIDRDFQIRVTANCSPIELSIERAVPFGLIASEVIAVALKTAHAAPGEEHAKLAISLETAGPDCAAFTLEGDFFPEEGFREQSLGRVLVDVLRSQLDGAIEFSGEPLHPRFRLSFPVLS